MPTLDPRKGVVGVYDHPAPASQDAVKSVSLANAGNHLAYEGARRLTALRDRLEAALTFDLPG